MGADIHAKVIGYYCFSTYFMLEEIKSLPVALTCVPKIKKNKPVQLVALCLAIIFMVPGAQHNEKEFEIYTINIEFESGYAFLVKT